MPQTVSVEPISYMSTSGCKFYTSYRSCETFLVEISHNNPFEMFSHENQTDQLIPVQGISYLFYVENDKVRYISMNAESPVAVVIPPNVLHGSINVSGRPAAVVNALLRHDAPAPNDYTPVLKLNKTLTEQYQRLLERLRLKHEI